MGARITAIRKAGGESSRVAVFVDGKEAFRVSEQMVGLLGLVVGRELAPDEFESLETDVEIGKAKDAALRLLGIRARSRSELEDRLSRKGFRPDAIESVIGDLDGAGLVDDRAFAGLWVDERTRLRPCGRMRLTQELRAKGVAPSVIDEAISESFDEVPEIELARRAAARKSARLKGDPKGRAKLHSFLLRRGFGYELAGQVTREFEDHADDHGEVGTGDPD